MIAESTLPDHQLWAESSHQAIILYGIDRRVHFWNAAAEDLFGWSAEEVTQSASCANIEDWLDASPLDAPFQGIVRRAGKDGRIRELALWRSRGVVLGRPDIPAIEFAEPLGSGDEDVFLRTEHPASPVRGAQVPERFDILLEHMPVALWQVDVHSVTNVFRRLREEQVDDLPAYLTANPTLVDFICETVTVRRVNRAAVELLNATSASQCLGSVRPLFEACPDATRRVMEAHFQGHRNFVEEIRLRRFDGSEVDVLFLATFPRPPEDMTVAFLVMLDIGHRLWTEDVLKSMRHDFARIAEQTAMGEVVASIAHELRQPLGAIVTNCEASLRWLARQEPNLAKVRQLSERAAEATIRAFDIIDGIREAATPGEHRRELIMMPDLVEKSLKLVREGGQSYGATLVSQVDGAPGPIMGDPVLLQQVIVNLVLNSLQAMGTQRHQPSVSVTVSAGTETTIVSVRDNGTGFPEDCLPRVFSGFFTTKEAGFGIGLTICRSIVTAHGGSIEACNHIEGGAVVCVELPSLRTPIPSNEQHLPLV